MNEWTVVTVIVTLAGLGAAVIKPLISLNTTITKLTEIIKQLDKNLAELTQKNSQAHGRLWDKLSEQDKTLDGHEKRLSVIEGLGK